MAQGFVKSDNLVESRTEGSDRAILDNLGGANITTDILLFDGNNNSTSQLINDTSQDPDLVQFSLYTDEDGDQRIQVTRGGNLGSFSNGTKLIMTNTGTQADIGTFFVFGSDGSSNFMLETVAGSGTATVFDAVTIADATLTRSDTIQIDNMANLSLPQVVVNDIAASQDGATGGDTGIDLDGEGGDAGGLGGEASPPDVLNEFSTFSQTAYIMRIVGGIKYKRTRIPLTYKDSTFDETIRLRGDARVVNTSLLEIGYPKAVTSGPLVDNKEYEIITKGSTPDSYFNSVSGTTGINWEDGVKFLVVNDTITGSGSGQVKPTSPPGLYIYNTASGDEIRAFSGSDNPWSEVSNVSILGNEEVLKTSSDKANVNKLYFHPTTATSIPEISKTNTAQNVNQDWVITGQSIAVSSYTHKLPVIVNGEQFYFLLKL
ncbi:hypothetical protein N9M52_00435 [bacterium]|nr:hypothetical protein [bacterium]MDA8752453.1 hypothetical protein [bacterium]